MTGAATKRDATNGRRAPLWLTLIMATVTLTATAVGGAILYQVSFEQQRARLIELVRSQARLIESVARFDSIHSQEDHPEGALAATLSQVSEAYAQADEFGSTGELILARREGGQIVFLLNRRSGNSAIPQPVRLESGPAEPMRRALDRQSGTMVGPDYQNVTVLAAYEPLRSLNLGIVAKIDLSEIRAPFIKAGAITGATALVFILLGAALFHYVSGSLTARLRSSVTNLNRAQRIAKLGNWDWNIVTGELLWSDQIYRIFGLEPQQFGATYEAFLQSVHPDDRGTVQAAVNRALSEGEAYSIDHRIVLPGGEERIVNEQGEVKFDASGKPLRMSGTVQDITEQKGAEREVIQLNEELERRVEARTEALRDSEEQLRLITDNVPAVIAYMDADQRYRFINKRYEEWFGVSSAEAYGRRVREVVGEAAYSAVADNLAKALSGKLVVFEAKIETMDAGTRDVQPTYVPHFSDDGTVKGVFVLVTDITERKRLESELLRQERLATLGQLTATVSHELRNPLGVIRTSAYTLRTDLDAEMPRVSRALERVERSVVRCDRIIDEMLDFTRITSLESAPTPLDDWLAGVLDVQVLPAELALLRDFGLPGTTVSFDHDRLRRAVINVFDNACQAMRGEGESKLAAGRKLLTVRTQVRAGRVEVVFEDQGPGIPVEVHERIFEPLFSTKGFGVGLGLPVVKQIMEQHGGGIEIETELGRGTTVRLWFDPEAGIKGAAA